MQEFIMLAKGSSKAVQLLSLYDAETQPEVICEQCKYCPNRRQEGLSCTKLAVRRLRKYSEQLKENLILQIA